MSFTKNTKKEFIYVTPKSSQAKNHFANLMYKLHSCRVKQRKNGKVFLESISGNHSFWINEYSDDNWKIIE